MRHTLFTPFPAFFFAACSTTPAMQPEKASDLKAYFASNEPGTQSGGVRLIPIKIPKGEFQIWTKRFGNNPTTKVLLLHGGPGCTHEYFESMEIFLPKEGIESKLNQEIYVSMQGPSEFG